MPLRVATLFSNVYITGSEIRMLNFARAVDPNVLEYLLIVIAHSEEQDRAHGSLRPQYAEAGVRIIDLDMPPWDEEVVRLHPLAIIPGLWKMWRTVWRIFRVLRKEKIDVLECHGESPIILGTVAAILARKKFVATAYGITFWDRPMWRTLARFIFFLNRALITDSRERAELFHKWLWRRLPCYVVPNGIEPPLPCRPREEVARELSIPLIPGEKIIGQVSRLVPAKGHYVVVDAAREVLANYPNARFIFCGFLSTWCPTDYVANLMKKAEEAGFADRLHIFGYPGPIGDVWQLIDIHVHGSLIDSSPIAIHEAMSLGKPTVGTREGGIPELVIDEKSGMVVPKNDSHAIAVALLRLLNEPALAVQFGAAAQERYRQRHRPEVMARHLEKVFLTVAREVQGEEAAIPV